MRSYNFTTVMGDGENNYDFILEGLRKYTRYSVIVQAFNKVGPGPLSEPHTAQTLEDGRYNIKNVFYILRNINVFQCQACLQKI